MANLAYYQNLWKTGANQQFPSFETFLQSAAQNDQQLASELGQTTPTQATTPGGPVMPPSVFSPASDANFKVAADKAINTANPNTTQFQVGDQAGFSDTATTNQQNRQTGQTSSSNQQTNQQSAQTGNVAGSTTGVQTGTVTGTSDQQSQQASQQDTTQDVRSAQQQATANESLARGSQTGTIGTTTGVTDTLGFGELLKGAGQQAVAADTDRTGFLTGLVRDGSSAFQGQVEDAVNRSLSGPGMQGVGQGAQGRVAGAAVADLARNQVGQQLQAAQQLAGPSAVTTVAQAGNPFLGQTSQQTQDLATTQQQTAKGTTGTTGSQQTTGSQTGVTTGSQQGTTGQTSSQRSAGTSNQATQQAANQTGSSQANQQTFTVDDLVATGREIGSAFGTSRSAGAGEQPQGGGGGGMWVICDELNRQGLMPDDECAAGTARAMLLPREVLEGYYIWAIPYVRWMRKSKLATWFILPFARARCKHLLGKPNFLGWLSVVWGEPACRWLLNRKIRKEVEV